MKSLLRYPKPKERYEQYELNPWSPLYGSAAFLFLSNPHKITGSKVYEDGHSRLAATPTGFVPVASWQKEIGRYATYFPGDDSQKLLFYPDTRIRNQYVPISVYAMWKFDGSAQDNYANLGGNPGNFYFWARNINGAPWSILFRRDNEAIAYLTYTTHNDFAEVAGWNVCCAAAVPWEYPKLYFNSIKYNNYNIYLFASPPSASISLGAPEGGSGNNELKGWIADFAVFNELLPDSYLLELSDKSNVDLRVGGIPLILPPKRVWWPATVITTTSTKKRTFSPRTFNVRTFYQRTLSGPELQPQSGNVYISSLLSNSSIAVPEIKRSALISPTPTGISTFSSTPEIKRSVVIPTDPLEILTASNIPTIKSSSIVNALVLDQKLLAQLLNISSGYTINVVGIPLLNALPTNLEIKRSASISPTFTGISTLSSNPEIKRSAVIPAGPLEILTTSNIPIIKSSSIVNTVGLDQKLLAQLLNISSGYRINIASIPLFNTLSANLEIKRSASIFPIPPGISTFSATPTIKRSALIAADPLKIFTISNIPTLKSTSIVNVTGLDQKLLIHLLNIFLGSEVNITSIPLFNALSANLEIKRSTSISPIPAGISTFSATPTIERSAIISADPLKILIVSNIPTLKSSSIINIFGLDQKLSTQLLNISSGYTVNITSIPLLNILSANLEIKRSTSIPLIGLNQRLVIISSEIPSGPKVDLNSLFLLNTLSAGLEIKSSSVVVMVALQDNLYIIPAAVARKRFDASVFAKTIMPSLNI